MLAHRIGESGARSRRPAGSGGDARWKTLFSCWLPRISRHCTSGRPASIMTENWRVKMATSCGEYSCRRIFGTAISLPFSLTTVGYDAAGGAASRISRFLGIGDEHAGLRPACPRPFPSIRNCGIVSSVDLLLARDARSRGAGLTRRRAGTLRGRSPPPRGRSSPAVRPDWTSAPAPSAA